MSTAQQIRAALEPALAPLGLVVEDVTVSPAGKRRLVRVLVDTDLGDLDPTDEATPVAPLSLDTVAEASRAVDGALESSDVMGQAPYVLEVSSPGVGRPLTTHDQFRRNVGRLVEVRHDGGTETGRLVRVTAGALTLDVPATKKEPSREVSVDLGTVERGTVQVEFKRAADETAPGADASALQEDN